MSDIAPAGSRRRGPRLRNGPHGYGLVTRLLHWLTVALLLGQFTVGWAMDLDEGPDAADDRLDADADRLEDDAEGRGEAAEEAAEAEVERREDALDALEDDRAGDLFSDVVTGDAFADGLSLPELHVVLGLSAVVLAGIRLVWRRTTPLPPWAAYLSAGERRLEAALDSDGRDLLHRQRTW